jgi:hypothetical protein
VKFFCLNWFVFFLFPVAAWTLEAQPWFGDVYEFHFLGTYAYSFFDRVQNGVPQLTSTFYSRVGYMGLDFSPSPEWSVDGDLQIADTTQESFNFRSAALQGRYLWYDDIVGDSVSFATGASARFTNTASLHDVSCPYHSHLDFELNFSVGKEFDVNESWRFRSWGFGVVGHGIYGSPWVRAIAAFECNFDDQHKFGFFVEGMNGYGRHTHVPVDHFHGYAKIRQKSIDLSFRYGYRIGVWGTLRAEYARRVLAKSCPQVVNSFVFSYLLPFSL